LMWREAIYKTLPNPQWWIIQKGGETELETLA